MSSRSGASGPLAPRCRRLYHCGCFSLPEAAVHVARQRSRLYSQPPCANVFCLSHPFLASLWLFVVSHTHRYFCACNRFVPTQFPPSILMFALGLPLLFASASESTSINVRSHPMPYASPNGSCYANECRLHCHRVRIENAWGPA